MAGIGNPDWKPGVGGNPNGRPRGSQNRRTAEAVKHLIDGGGKDPLDRLSELVSDPDPGIAAQASSILVQYYYSKNSPRPEPRYIITEAPLDLPKMDSLANAVARIAAIQTAVAENRLDVLSGQDLIAMAESYIRGLNQLEVQELQERLLAVEASIANNPQAQLPHIEGGLPTPPGFENVIMPRINGAPASLSRPPQQIESQSRTWRAIAWH